MTDEEMWEAALALWKHMSEMEDCEVDVVTTDFKNDILNELGYDSMEYGCPFCEKYHDTMHCPIGDCNKHIRACFGTTYGNWEDLIDEEERHSQEYATSFYEYLIELNPDQ